MNHIKYILINLVPIAIVMAIIFIASSQTSDQQDISPVLDTVTDENWVRVTAASILQLVNTGAETILMFMFTYPYAIIIMGAVLVLLALVTFFRVRKSRQSAAKKTLKTFVYLTLIIISIGAVFLAINSSTVIELARANFSLDQLRTLLQQVQFTYSGQEVSLATHGVDGLLEFVLRKSAHFTLFALLGFFVFLASIKLNGRYFRSFIIAMSIVIAYAALDEYRQTFIPSRSGMVADVILDAAGGLFGTGMAWLKTSISRRFS
ncbi:VanZ family protein [Salipaludibacillus agaradhaerens]|uniref:VanZ family protein n=1 Tax=Salipaludibacillus agaradhaerens TaxID=76935 RepID=A0A9Q4B5K6_SALAG|nr:VanZ family protein [Salipaludibacillus agaradhaerens]MCR6098739.1 VanZ family protein [Salipaludibacillus agaradhaerens]MCR6115746.1 VanZ family protein [Salipaludibacillus agaradhaerens]